MIFVFLFILTGLALNTEAQDGKPAFDKSSFYKSMQSESSNEVDAVLNQLKTLDIPERDAYIGALTMRKAGLVGPPSKKLNTFKSGHKKLEAAIKKDTLNAEFRFLRLIIQEQAPGYLKYRGNIKQDSEYVRRSYKTLPDAVQQAIVNYSKKSKILKPGDF